MRKLGLVVALAGTLWALGAGSSLSSQNRAEGLERPPSFRNSFVKRAGIVREGFDQGTFAAAVRRWNGDVFWAPATASKNTITRFGDEARAVFGPIPQVHCAATQARFVPVQVDGIHGEAGDEEQRQEEAD